MNSPKKGLTIVCFYYLPAILWMGLIFYLSSVPGLKTGADSMGLEIFLRKTAHLFEYFILTLLFWRTIRKQTKLPFKKVGLICFSLVIVYAISDEFHQHFVVDRAGKVVDVFVDGAGAILGISFANFLIKNKKH